MVARMGRDEEWTASHNIKKKTERKRIPLQSIRLEHILHLDRNSLSKKLIDDCLVLNYQYGKSRDIIYDYDEIEIYLRNMISSLVLINTDRLRCLNYQFDLYRENASLINDVRVRIKQKRLSNDDRNKFQNLTVGMNNDDMLNHLGSLDYVFTYLRTSILDSTLEEIPFQNFVQHYMHSPRFLDNKILYREPFSTVQLQYIIDLYEIVEESVFDRALRAYVKIELQETIFTDDECQRVIKQFSHDTYEKQTISPLLKNIDRWISMLKRLMIRILNANIELDERLQVYLERTYLWSDPITDADLATFQVDNDILLRHTYVILCALERKQYKSNRAPLPQKKATMLSIDEQQQEVQAQSTAIIRSRITPKVISDKNRKIRV
ncbi:unnamed protein product [Rotaria sp. Silwood2]|nr:unnamed protein product [Rotaria sp. Silwood2]